MRSTTPRRREAPPRCRSHKVLQEEIKVRAISGLVERRSHLSFDFFLEVAMSSDDSYGRLLTVKETAEYLNRSVRWVYTVLRYEIPVVRLGGRILFERSELDKYVERCREVPER